MRIGFSHRVILLILALSIVRMIFAAMLGLTYDETYIAVMSRHLSLSYIDHPPLAMVLSAISQFLTANSENLALRLPAIVLFGGTTWLIYRIGAVLFDERSGFYAALLMSLTPLFSFYLGFAGTTDTPMLFALAAATLCLAHALFDEPPSRKIFWIAAGFFSGLAILSKYTAGIALLGFAVFILTSQRHRKLLLTPWPYIAAAIAVLVFLPVLIWNAQHDWLSFKFQGSRAWSSGTAPLAVVKYLALQILFLFPLPWLLMIVAMWKALRLGPVSERGWFLVCAGALPVLFFTLLRIFPSVDKGYHWVAPGYLLLFPLAGLLVAELMTRHAVASRNWLRAMIAANAILLFAVAIDLRTSWGWNWVPSLAIYDPLITDAIDWNDIAPAMARANPDRKLFVVGVDWEECTKIDWALRASLPLLCLTNKPLHFALLRNQRDFIGQDALIPGTGTASEVAEYLKDYFESFETLDHVVISKFEKPVTELTILRGRNFRRVFPWPNLPASSAE
jgi:4-amino-4-deoxy-L-arabinose transferase-like glycosyltransferase